MVGACNLLLAVRLLVSLTLGGLGRRKHTHEWRAIAIRKDIAHESLCINASILITGARRCKNGLGDLKIDQWGSRSLSVLERIVRDLRRENTGGALQYGDIQAKETMGLDHSRKHGEGRRLCAVLAIWQSKFP